MLYLATLFLASAASTPTCQDIKGAFSAQNCCHRLQEGFTVPDTWCPTTSTVVPYDCQVARAKVDLISITNATVALTTPFDGGDAYLFEQSFGVLKSLTGVSLDVTKSNFDINKPTDVLQWYRSDVVVDGAVSLPELGITLAQLQEAYGSELIGVGTKDGEPYAVPVVTQLKGVLWYNTDIVTSAPESWDAFMQLLQTLQMQGHTKPLCMGGDAGWPLTDVLENIVAEDANSVYTPWANGELAFNDTAIKNAVTKVAALQPYVNLMHGWQIVNQKVLDGECALTIMPHFGPGFTDANILSDSKMKSAFIFNDYTVLGAMFTVAKSSTEAVRQAMVWQSTPLFANSFVGLTPPGVSNVLISPNLNVDVSTYNSFAKPFAERVTSAIRSNTAVFDASDRLPSTLDNKLQKQLLKLVNGGTTVDDALKVLECTRTDSCPVPPNCEAGRVNKYGLNCEDVKAEGYCGFEEGVGLWPGLDFMSNKAACPVTCERTDTNSYGITCEQVAQNDHCDFSESDLWSDTDYNRAACPASCGDRADTNVFSLTCEAVNEANYCGFAQENLWSGLSGSISNAIACPATCC